MKTKNSRSKKMPKLRRLRNRQPSPINLTIEVGSTTLKLRDLLKLSQGSLLELDRTAGELMDIKVNNTVIAKGEVVETTEGKYGITVVEIVAPLDRIKPA